MYSIEPKPLALIRSADPVWGIAMSSLLSEMKETYVLFFSLEASCVQSRMVFKVSSFGKLICVLLSKCKFLFKNHIHDAAFQIE